MIQTSLTQITFYHQPIRTCIIYHNKFLSWSADEDGGVILGVHVVGHDYLHVGLDLGVGGSVGGGLEAGGLPEVFQLLDEEVFLSGEHFA